MWPCKTLKATRNMCVEKQNETNSDPINVQTNPNANNTDNKTTALMAIKQWRRHDDNKTLPLLQKIKETDTTGSICDPWESVFIPAPCLWLHKNVFYSGVAWGSLMTYK